jgi:hypothetical protein
MKCLYSYCRLLLWMVALLYGSFVLGQAPPNDACTNATFVPINSFVSGAVLQATIDTAPGPCFVSSYGPGVWFTFAGTGNRVAINIMEQGSMVGTVYKGNACNLLTCAIVRGFFLSNWWQSQYNNDNKLYLGAAEFGAAW